jgi:putative mRNA 3-end processing factor
MKFKFLGGANEIGSTSLLMETNNFSGIFEYGMTPSNPPKYPLEAPEVDNIFLSHAHLDHSGMTPWIVNKYDANFYSTELTYALSRILLRDNLKICHLEGYPKMYSKSDIMYMAEKLNQVIPGSNYGLDHSELIVHSAGHIPGSVMYQLNILNDSNILFTGDINTIDTRLLSGTKGIKCDILIMEATYAGREHELRPKIEYKFQEIIKDTVESGGKVIIPAFAVGRSQEMLLILADLDFEIWMDGLGVDVTKLLLKFPNNIKNSKKLNKIFKTIGRIRTQDDRKNAVSGDIILTTSGMLDGGPVLRYIKELNNNKKNVLLLTGYQVEGSNGRLLMEKGMINIHGTMEKINMGVEYFDFSAHAGNKELLNFIRTCDPEHVILFHSDKRELLKQDLVDSYQVHLPQDGQDFSL